MNTSHRIRHLGAAPRVAVVAALTLIATGAAANAATQDAPHQASRAFVRLAIPARKVYVGQSIPVTIRAYFEGGTGVTLTASPLLTDSNFTLRAGEPSQGRTLIGGEPYLVVTWKDRLSPVKAGRYSLGIDLPSTLEWQDVTVPTPVPDDDSAAQDPFGADPFGDSLFGGGDPFAQMQKQMQRMMNRFTQSEVGPVQHREVVLHAPRVSLEVDALPAAGAPAGFTGAVGHFALAASADPMKLRAGEPISLSIRVTGEGNFDRVNVAGLPESSDFKTYTPSATDGKEEKTFHQPVVPLRAGVSAIPPVFFSYFDPDAGKYVTTSSAPIPLEVAPGTGAAATSNGAVPEATSGPTLAANADTIGTPVPTLAPVFTRRWFWELQAALGAAVGMAALLVVGRKRLFDDPRRQRRRRAARAVLEHRAAMDRALATGDATAFFAEARAAIQHSLGARLQLEPGAISLRELEARLDPDEVQRLRPVFDADAARFSAGGARDADLSPWKQLVDRELEHIERMEAA